MCTDHEPNCLCLACYVRCTLGQTALLLLTAVSPSDLTPINSFIGTKARVNRTTWHRHSILAFVDHSMARIKHGPNVYKKCDPECVCFALRPAKTVETPTPGLIGPLVNATASGQGMQSIEGEDPIFTDHSSMPSSDHPLSRVDGAVENATCNSIASATSVNDD